MWKNFFKKISLPVVLCFVFFVLCFQFGLAAGPLKFYWEVSIPGFNPDQIDGLGTLIKIIIRWSYWLAVLFAFYKIVEVGFKYMTSKGNTDIVAFAGKSLQNVLFGLLILFGSYLILNTINADLVAIPNISGTHKVPFSISPQWEKKVLGNRLFGGILKSEDYWWKSGDSDAAVKDLTSGIAKPEISMIIAQILLHNKEWMPESCKGNYFEFGPIKTGHASSTNPTYRGPCNDKRSCHTEGYAVDLVIWGKDNKPNLECTRAVKTWIEQKTKQWEKDHSKFDLESGYIVCDETGLNYSRPHIHIESKKCSISPSCGGTPNCN